MIDNLKIFGLQESVEAIKHSTHLGKNPNEYVSTEIIPHDYELAYRLGSCGVGEGHDCYLKGIRVLFDLKCTQYFDHELQRYRFVDIVSSQSIQKGFVKLIQNSKTMDLKTFKLTYFIEDMDDEYLEYFKKYISKLDENTNINKVRPLIPEGLMMWKTISTNYLQLKTIYNQRKNHPLNEWKEFCKMIEELPLLGAIVRGKGLTDNDINNIKWVRRNE